MPWALPIFRPRHGQDAQHAHEQDQRCWFAAGNGHLLLLWMPSASSAVAPMSFFNEELTGTSSPERKVSRNNINNGVLLVFSLNEFEDLYRLMFTNVNPGFCEIPTIDWGVANKIVITWYKNWYHMVQPCYQAWIYESCSTFPYMLAPK